MNENSNDNKNGQDKLRKENGLRKNKLTSEKGGEFFYPLSENELPPEVENEFLKNIEEFDKAFDSSERVTIFEYIGKPELKKASEITDNEMKKALDKVMLLLNKNGIALDTLCEVDNRTLYKFITEELILEEIDNIRIKGMVLNFIYEEFHPNHEYDIRNHCSDFFKSFLDKKSDYYPTFLTKEAENNKKLKHFRDSYGSFRLHSFEITNISFDEEKAKADYQTDFTAIIENSNEKQRYKGAGKIELLYKWDFWCVDKVWFPDNNI